MPDGASDLDLIREVELRHYRTCFHVGRAMAAYSPLIGPLPEKFLLVELVSVFLRHAHTLAERLWELGVEKEAVTGCPTGLYARLAQLASAGDPLPPLVHLLTLAVDLPAEYARIADDLPNVPERRPDREMYWDMALGLRRVLDLPHVAKTAERLGRSAEPLAELMDPAQLSHEPLPAPSVSERFYGPALKTTTEPVMPSVRPANREELAFYVHNQLQIEFVAIDIAMRNISDFDDVPLSFYLDQARHAHDEVRHSQMLIAELDRLEATVSDFPFEVPDRFSILIDLPLPHRLVVLSRTGESEAIEAIQKQIPYLREFGAHSVADMMRNVLYDEVRHAWYGNKWLRWLCGNDDDKVREETAAALRSYNTALQTLGSRMPAREPDYLDSVARRPKGIDPQLRAHAGFTDEELALMRGLRHWPV